MTLSLLVLAHAHHLIAFELLHWSLKRPMQSWMGLTKRQYFDMVLCATTCACKQMGCVMMLLSICETLARSSDDVHSPLELFHFSIPVSQARRVFISCILFFGPGAMTLFVIHC